VSHIFDGIMLLTMKDYNLALPENLTLDDILRLAQDFWTKETDWWYVASLHSIKNKWFEVIKQRENDFAYLMRMWLTKPKMNKDGTGFESGSDAFLHWFCHKDTDNSVHSHPWAFRTSVLEGWYKENLPPLWWYNTDKVLGPPLSENIVLRLAGDTVDHEANDLHSVGEIERGTFTFMRTGPRIQIWNFHPEGQKMVPWEEYLGTDRAGSLLKSKKEIQ
jgi:hypothetical protein